jgi:hypothetical protein
MASTIRVNRDYLEWAHGPAADDGYPPAVRIIEAVQRCKGKLVVLDLTDDELRTELHSCASLWDHPETASENGAGNPSARRTAARIMNQLGPWRRPGTKR